MNKALVFLTILKVVWCDLEYYYDDFNLSEEQGSEPGASCRMADGTQGKCVQFFLCDSNDKIIMDGRTVIDIRETESVCHSYQDICCGLSSIKDDVNPITPKLAQRKGCGWRNPDGVGFKITGAEHGEAYFGEFPWMVVIFSIDSPDVPIGGGSIIHPRAVLTAGHTVNKVRKLKVRAGEWDLNLSTEYYPHQDRDVDTVKVHHKFNKDNGANDIAILFLKKAFDLAPNVGVVCLPPAGIRAVGDTECFASGWGKKKFDSEQNYQNILKKVNLPVVERGECQILLQKTRLGPFFQLGSSFMCAGGRPGQDTCLGDGGSPLVCPVEGDADRYVQNGIVSWGIDCFNGHPGVYADVAILREWIDFQMDARGYSNETYSI
ncbi:phenoloxidase-activating factor 2-like [Leptidea sinapis]|uniref:phenoloxidase-activating factor 2-like n=1 Tax=Leptidea sinapis TaxID=189913 RepID=UPI00213F8A88|nr:phenoloxidase-activating factor 2-like [Leptidea sinapis]